ncbi:MAG TPA: hypothetical protein VL123_05820 [Candidatus Udaeobacter sp.]|jgi:hypothetical protein|nr:hypothetical protein [Candidatus Udaeobacter sp.]
MTRRRLYAAICLVTSIFTIDLTACTPGPASTRDLTDPARHDPFAEQHWKLGRVSIGTPLTVTTRDSGKVVGRYAGFRHLDDDEYASRYAASAADSASPLHGFTIGSPVRMIQRDARRDSGMFAGFDYGVVRYRRAGDKEPRVAPIQRLGSLEGAGTSLGADSLAAWQDAGRLPMATVLVLRSSTSGHTLLSEKEHVREIPLESIRALHAKGVPATIAILVAAGFIAGMIVAYANRPHPKPQSQSCGGNPGVYTVVTGAR